LKTEMKPTDDLLIEAMLSDGNSNGNSDDNGNGNASGSASNSSDDTTDNGSDNGSSVASGSVDGTSSADSGSAASDGSESGERGNVGAHSVDGISADDNGNGSGDGSSNGSGTADSERVRKRGRPAGSTNKKKSTSNDDIRLDDKGPAPKDVPYSKIDASETRAGKFDITTVLVPFLGAMFQLPVLAGLGEHWQLDGLEAKLLADRLEGCMKMLPKSNAKKLQKTLDKYLPLVALIITAYMIFQPRVAMTRELKKQTATPTPTDNVESNNAERSNNQDAGRSTNRSAGGGHVSGAVASLFNQTY